MINTTSLKDRAGRKCSIIGDPERIQQQRGFRLQRKERCRDTEKKKLISGAQTSNGTAASTAHCCPLQLTVEHEVQNTLPALAITLLAPSHHLQRMDSSPKQPPCSLLFLPRRKGWVTRVPQGYSACHSSTVSVTQGPSQASVLHCFIPEAEVGREFSDTSGDKLRY